MSIKCLAQCSLELPFREVTGDIAGLCLTRVRLLLHGVRKSLFLSVPQSSCPMQSFNLGLEFVAVFLIEQDNGQCSCHSFSMIQVAVSAGTQQEKSSIFCLLFTYLRVTFHPPPPPFCFSLLSRLFVLLHHLPEALERKLGQSL